MADRWRTWGRGAGVWAAAQALAGVEAGVLTAALHLALGWPVPRALPLAMAASVPLLLGQAWLLWRLTAPRTPGAAPTRAQEVAIGLGTVAGFVVSTPLALLAGTAVIVAVIVADVPAGPSTEMFGMPAWLVGAVSAAVFLALAALAAAWSAVGAWLRGEPVRATPVVGLGMRGTPRVQLLVALLGGLTVGWLPARIAAALANSEAWMEQVHAFLPSATPQSLPLLQHALTSGGVADQVALALVVILAGPIAEEVVFRGFLWRALDRWMHPGAVLLVTSAVFALAHADPVHTPAVLFIGLFLGWLRWTSGSLMPGLLAHVVNNGFGVLTAWTTGGHTMLPEATIGALGAMAIVVAGCAWVTRTPAPTDAPWAATWVAAR